jgi:hypothetical protein
MTKCRDILEEILKPKEAGFSAAHARYLLSLNFTPRQHARYANLAASAQEGTLNNAQKFEIDQFLLANTFLSIIQSKARISLKDAKKRRK